MIFRSFQFIVLAAFVAAANAGVAPLAYQAAYAAAPLIDAEYDPHPQYSYGYGVKDALTGDDKQHHESRDGDVVKVNIVHYATRG